MLIICIGTDMFPDVAFAYECAEHDIMLRQPRNIKRDHLVNLKLISYSYIQVGTFETISAFYTYFIVLNDYGFKPWFTWLYGQQYGTEPAHGDVYSPLAGPCKGNSNCNLGARMWHINQVTNADNWIDQRLFFHWMDPIQWAFCRFIDYRDFFHVSSEKTKFGDYANICYTTEAIFYS